MKTYLERFKKMVEELKNHPQIEVTNYVVNQPATDEEIEIARERFALTQDMLDFYKQANGLELSWTIKGETDGYDDASIVLSPVQEVFQDWVEILAEDNSEFEPLHPLDFFVPEACAALYIDDETENPMVYFHKLGEEMDSLKIDFKAYLETLLLSKGFYYWQSARVSSLNSEERFTETNLMEKIPKLFPTVNLDDILKK